MDYYIRDIVAEVRKALDENEVGGALIELGDSDTLSLNCIIEQKITDAIVSVTKEAPSGLLDMGKEFASTVFWEKAKGIGMGYTLLPDDYMRLVIFQMSDWRRPVLEAIWDTDKRYFLQKSKFPGIRGGIDKPVCAITTYATGKVMEFYSCTGGDSVSVKVARYIPYPCVKEGKVSVCSRLYRAAIYYTAGLVCATYRENEHAKVLFTLATDYLK